MALRFLPSGPERGGFDTCRMSVILKYITISILREGRMDKAVEKPAEALKE